MTKLRVAGGGFVQLSGGEMSLPSQVYWAGIGERSEKAPERISMVRSLEGVSADWSQKPPCVLIRVKNAPFTAEGPRGNDLPQSKAFQSRLTICNAATFAPEPRERANR